MVSWAGGNAISFEQASRMLFELAGLTIDPRQVARITERIGRELEQCRNRSDFIDSTLLPTKPYVAVISLDGGRAQTRAEDQGPGVHKPEWRETKVAHLQILDVQESKEDPHPDVPHAFVDKAHIRALVAQMKNTARTKQDHTQKAALPSVEHKRNPEKRNKNRATCVLKSCVASVCTAEQFAPIVRDEVRRLGMEDAPRKLFIADGGSPNWAVHEKVFSHWPVLLDFVHLVTYLFAVAGCLFQQADAAWQFYVTLVTHAWNGQVENIISLLKQHQARIGLPTKDTPENDPISILAKTLNYIINNEKRMDYPSMRKRGLPITSCNVESLIKQVNQRVKASDKFWLVPNLEAVLQIRAAELSTTKRWDLFWDRRNQDNYPVKMAA